MSRVFHASVSILLECESKSIFHSRLFCTTRHTPDWYRYISSNAPSTRERLPAGSLFR
jgi:hypothetical protein